MAPEIEPMQAWGSPQPGAASAPECIVKASLQRFADGIGMSERTVIAWRRTAAKWPAVQRRNGISFTVHRLLGSGIDEAERWASLEAPPFNECSGRRPGHGQGGDA
ncbi:DUF6192 family protein [Streptomyces vinaceus]|uniref:DUF6192 family protein n=1 Tax=Streptomyces vinaceus TaxID=1960 RepID=UPI0035E25E3B